MSPTLMAALPHCPSHYTVTHHLYFFPFFLPSCLTLHYIILLTTLARSFSIEKMCSKSPQQIFYTYTALQLIKALVMEKGINDETGEVWRNPLLI